MSEKTYGGYTAGDLREMRDAAEGGIDYELYNGEMLHDYHPDEARFYIAARSAIPALLDEAARLREALEMISDYVTDDPDEGMALLEDAVRTARRALEATNE
jgi:hypothetical protein